MANDNESRERFPDLSESEILTEHQELRLIRNPTRVETYRNAIRPCVNVLPPNPLPRWKKYPLEQKFPIVPAPDDEFVYARNSIGEDIYVSSRKTKFDIEDPQIQATPKGYTSLHDRNLKDYFENNPKVFEALVDQGLVDPSDGGVHATKKEFNTYRAYLGRLRNNTVNDDLRFQDALGKAQIAQSCRIGQFDKREHRAEKDEKKRRYLEAFMKNKKARQLALQLKEKERSLAYCETRAKEEVDRAVKREMLRQEVKCRIVKMRRAERRRARRILLEWYCRQLYADMMRKAIAEHKKTSRHANLVSFIKSKREFQKSRMKYTHALEQRKLAENECRRNRMRKHFEYSEANRLEISKQKALQKQMEADREQYLIRKFGMRWLSVVRNQVEYKKNYHDSVWRVRQNLIDMVRNLKQESGRVSFTNFIQGLVSLKPGKQEMPSMSEETRSIMNYILDLLIKAAFDTYKKSNRPCAHAYESLANRRRILGQKNLKPDDFKQPHPHFRAIPVVPFHRPPHPYPCGVPYIEEPEGKCLEDEMITNAKHLVHEELKHVAKRFRGKKKPHKSDKVIAAAVDQAIKSLEPVHRDIPSGGREQPVKDVPPKPAKRRVAKPLKRVDRGTPSGDPGERVIHVPSKHDEVLPPPMDQSKKPSERVIHDIPSGSRRDIVSDTSSETDKVIGPALSRSTKSLESVDGGGSVVDVPSEPENRMATSIEASTKSLESVDHGTPSEPEGPESVSVTDSSLEPEKVISAAVDGAKKSLKSLHQGAPSRSRSLVDVPSQAIATPREASKKSLKIVDQGTPTESPVESLVHVPSEAIPPPRIASKKSVVIVDQGTPTESPVKSVVDVPSEHENLVPTPMEASKKSLESVHKGTVSEVPEKSVVNVPSEPDNLIPTPMDISKKSLDSVSNSSSEPENVTASALDRAIKSLECVDGGTPSEGPDIPAIESIECVDSGESVTCSTSESDKVVGTALDRAIKSLECVDRGESVTGSSESDKVVGTALDRAIESLECVDQAVESLECVDRGESVTCSSSESDKVVCAALDRAIKSLECVDRGESVCGSSESDKVSGAALDRAIESLECVDCGTTSRGREETASDITSEPENVVAAAMNRAIKSLECIDLSTSDGGQGESDLDQDGPSSAESGHTADKALGRAIKSLECPDDSAYHDVEGTSATESRHIVDAALGRAVKSLECIDGGTSSGGRPNSVSDSSAASDTVVSAAMDRAIKSAECNDAHLFSAGHGDSNMEGVCGSLIGEMARACVETVLPPTPVTPSFFTELEMFGPRRDPVFPLDGRNDRPQSDEARPLPSDLRDTVLRTLSNVQTQLDAIRHELRQYGVIPPDRGGGRR